MTSFRRLGPTTIDDLIELVPPPNDPIDATGNWRRVEAELGVALPADYIQLVEQYGKGKFVDFFGMLDPFGPSEWEDHYSAPSLVASSWLLMETQGPIRDEYPEWYPYPLFPERDGLVQWAVTDNGGYLCWLTRGHPHDWPIVVWDSRGRYEEYDTGTVEFLRRWFTGQITSSILPSLEVSDLSFRPFMDTKSVFVELSEGSQPYDHRLQILLDALAPVADRESWQTRAGGRSDRFTASERDWHVTYETINAHQIGIRFPPADEQVVRALIASATEQMGCQIVSATHHGQPIWT